MSEQKIICGDSLIELKKFPDNHFDSVVTDPPYGISFMAKKWDYDVPSVELWKEVLRVLKPGGYILVACGTRTQHRMAVNIEDAGFEIRDIVSWVYGSGFPKSLNISKAIDAKAGVERKVVGQIVRGSVEKAKQFTTTYAAADANKNNKSIFGYGVENITEPATDDAKQWDGWGTALKPAQELWTLARKPISESTVAENVLKYGTGGINIDDCRVKTNDDTKRVNKGVECGVRNDKSENEEQVFGSPLGRFPANVIFSHHPDCKMIGYDQVKSSHGGYERKAQSTFVSKEHQQNNTGYGDENGIEQIEKWECVDGCPIKELNEQSGITKGATSNGNAKTGIESDGITPMRRGILIPRNDIGGASRFFYCAKASPSERNFGLENFEEKITSDGREKSIDNPFQRGETERKNSHPTVKPISLMRYLTRLITPTNGVCLDPFNGSGSTGIACKLENFNYVGIEKDKEYCEISEARIKAWEDKPENKKEKELKDKNQLDLF